MIAPSYELFIPQRCWYTMKHHKLLAFGSRGNSIAHYLFLDSDVILFECDRQGYYYVYIPLKVSWYLLHMLILIVWWTLVIVVFTHTSLINFVWTIIILTFISNLLRDWSPPLIWHQTTASYYMCIHARLNFTLTIIAIAMLVIEFFSLYKVL